MPRLINFGSLCIDRVYSVDAIARAGETLAARQFSVFAGGKGLNQSIAAARAGASVLHVGVVGEDGAWLVDLLQRESVTPSVRTDTNATGHAVIQVTPSGQNSIVIVGGANRTTDADDRARALDACTPTDWLLLQNEVNDMGDFLAQAANRGLRVCLNLAPFDQGALDYPYDGLSVLIVNGIEAGGLAGSDDADVALARLRARLPKTRIVVTLGAQGLLYADGDVVGRLPPYAVTAVDETAAGDAFIGYFMAALLADSSFHSALCLASAAGALAVTRAGAAPSLPWRTEVDAFVRERPPL